MPDTKVKATVSLELVDGQQFEFTTTTYMCAADRVAFEKRFGVTSAALARAGKQAMASAEPDGDSTQITEAGALAIMETGELKEEWIMFFSWRAAVRALPEDFGHMPFDRDPDDEHPKGGFVQQLADYDPVKNAPTEDGSLDPPPTGARSE